MIQFSGYSIILNQTVNTTGTVIGPPADGPYPGVYCSVYNTNTTTLANIYDSNFNQRSNPFLVGIDGSFSFYGTSASYDLLFTATLPATNTAPNVIVESFPSSALPTPDPYLVGQLIRRSDDNALLMNNAGTWGTFGTGGGGGGGVAIAAGTQTATTNTIVFSNSNGITFGMSGSTRITASYTVPSTAGLLSAFNISGGTTSNNLSALTFSNSNGVSFGLNGSVMTASVAAAGGAQTGISGMIVSDATYTSGTVSFSNQNGVTIGSSVNGATQFIRLSVATNYQSQGAYLTTAMQSNAATISNINVSAGTTSNNLSAFTFSNGSGVSFGLNGSVITASVAAAGGAQTGISGMIVSDATYTSGTVSFSNQNGVTIGSSVNGASQFIRLSVATNYQSQGAYLTTADLSANSSKYVQNWKLTGNTSGTTSSAQGTDLWLAGGNGVTVSGSSNSISFSVATNYQSQGAYLTTAALSGDTSKYVQNWKLTGNTAGTTSSAQGTDLWFSGGNNVTLSGNSNTIIVSAFNQTNQSAIKGLGASNTGNTAGNTGLSTGIDWVLAGSQAVTISQSTTAGGPNTLWVNAPNAAAGNVTFSAGANSAGLASIVFSNSNGVSFGLNGSTITASAAGGGGGIGGGVSTGGNTAGSTGTVTTGNIVFVGLNAISLSQSTGAAGSNATITINAPATSSLVGTGGIILSSNGSTISISQTPMAHYEPFPLLQSGSTTYAPVSSSWYFQPMNLDQPMSGGRVNMMVAHGSTASLLNASSASFNSGSTGTLSINVTYARQAALYSLGAGTNSTRLESFWSNQFSISINHLIKVSSGGATSLTVSLGATMSYPSAMDSAGGVTTTTVGNSSTLTSAASTMATAGVSSILTSVRNMLSSQLMIPVPFNTTINPGLYFVAMQWQSASTTAATGANISTPASQFTAINQYGLYGNTNTAARLFGYTAASSGSAPFPGIGVWSGASANPPATVAFSDIRTQASQVLNYFNIVNSTI